MTFILIILCMIILSVLSMNIYVRLSSYKQIVNKKNYSKLKDIDCLLVLGCGIINNERPTLMLKDRIEKSVELYKLGLSQKIIMSGDHSRNNHDEVNIMKNHAIKNGVPSQDIFMDHAGFCSYDSIYRAKEIFGAEKIIIVTQKYHLYRSLYIANKLGIKAYGIKADARIYVKILYYEMRELLAVCKNIFKCRKMPKPRFLGEKISLNQSGDVTNDK